LKKKAGEFLAEHSRSDFSHPGPVRHRAAAGTALPGRPAEGQQHMQSGLGKLVCSRRIKQDVYLG